MKTLGILAFLTLSTSIAAAQEAPRPYDDDDYALPDQDDGYDPQAYQQFETQLAPYGSWENDQTYGRVWVPSTAVVGGSFTPYSTGGHWVWASTGWTWASDYSWGWAPFHYGRWVYAGSRWCWRPGRVWGPGWVAWRNHGRYVGWAPLPPRHFVRDHRFVPAWRFTPRAHLGQARMSFYAPQHIGFRPRAYFYGGARYDHRFYGRR